MAEFVLSRNHVLSGFGQRIVFNKGEPTYVPPMLHKEAAAIGAERVDGDKVDPLPDAEKPKEILTAAERIDALVAAIELIVERNRPEDFGGDNRPNLASLNKIVELHDPELTKRERDDAWKAYKAKVAE